MKNTRYHYIYIMDSDFQVEPHQKQSVNVFRCPYFDHDSPGELISSHLILIMVPLVSYSVVISPLIDLAFLFLIFLGPQKCHCLSYLCSQHCPIQVPQGISSKIRPNTSDILSQSIFLHFIIGCLEFQFQQIFIPCNSAC